MDYQTFPSRESARAEVQKMRQYGWPQATVDWIEDRDPATDFPRKVWIIKAAEGPSHSLYLRADGYVR